MLKTNTQINVSGDIGTKVASQGKGLKFMDIVTTPGEHFSKLWDKIEN
jgi:hypothetical protein